MNLADYPKYKSRLDIDNQLGGLHNMTKEIVMDTIITLKDMINKREQYINKLKTEDKAENKQNEKIHEEELEIEKRDLSMIEKQLEKENVEISNIEFEKLMFEDIMIYKGEKILGLNLAKKIRKFIQNIDEKDQKLLSDENSPQDEIYYKLKSSKLLLLNTFSIHERAKITRKILLSNKSLTDTRFQNTKNGWKWEAYSSDIWRLKPKSLDAFFNSPIYTLISIIEKKLSQSFGDKLNNKTKICWVIQKLMKGAKIGQHMDIGREYAFVYYLTPNEWEYEEYGGELVIISKKERPDIKDKLIINPTFNSMVLWENDEKKMPLHYVNTIKEQNPKGERIALVGFYNIKKDFFK